MVLCMFPRSYMGRVPSLTFYLKLKDYVVQGVRFEIFEEVGCLGAYGSFGLSVLLLDYAPLSFPVFSLLLYSRTL